MARMTPPKSPMVCEKYHTGCMWRLYSLFDLRQGHSKTKLLSDRRHLERLDNGNFMTKQDLPNKFDQKRQSVDGRMKNKPQTVDSDMESKRNLEGEELSTEQQIKKIATDEMKHMQSNSKLVGHLPKNNGKASTTRQRSHHTPLHGLKDETKHRKPSSSISVENSLNKLNSAALPEVSRKEVHGKDQRGCGCKSINIVNNDQLNEINLLPAQMNAAEAIVNQKFIDGKCLRREGVNQQSKQLSDALQILNSNKELFIKLLQDPNSLLVKHIQDLRESQAEKHENKSLSEANISGYWTSKARKSEDPASIHKLNSCDIYPSKEGGDSQFSERIIVLKPGPTSMQNSAGSINDSSSQQSYYIVRNNGQNKRPENFSFSHIKRKLRHAIGVSRKEQQSKLINGTLHGSPCQGSEDGCKGKRVEIIRNSPGLIDVDSGGMTKSSYDINKRDNIGKLKEYESSIGHEAASIGGSGLGNSNILVVSHPKQKESGSLVEARKHLSESLNNGNKDKSYFEKQAQKTWGRVKSFPEYDFLPTRSPVREWESRFCNYQMRFSPYSSCQVVYENKWRLQKEKKTGCSSPLRQDIEVSPETTSCMEKTTRTETNDAIYQGETDASETVSEVDCTDKALDQSTDTTNMFEENECFKSSTLDQPSTSSPDFFPSTPSRIQRVEDSDGSADKGEQPSPVSILEQFLVDVTSPTSTISEPAEEHHSAPLRRSPLDPEISIASSLNENGLISEYIRAVLQASSLNWDEVSMMCHSDQLLEPFLFNAVSLQANQFHGDRRLLFDCINEVLAELYHSHLRCTPWVSLIMPNALQQLSIEKAVIHEVMKDVDWHLLLQPSPRTMQQLIEKDIARSGTWLNIRNDAEDVVFEMVEDVLEELIMETIL